MCCSWRSRTCSGSCGWLSRPAQRRAPTAPASSRSSRRTPTPQRCAHPRSVLRVAAIIVSSKRWRRTWRAFRGQQTPLVEVFMGWIMPCALESLGICRSKTALDQVSVRPYGAHYGRAQPCAHLHTQSCEDLAMEGQNPKPPGINRSRSLGAVTTSTGADYACHSTRPCSMNAT